MCDLRPIVGLPLVLISSYRKSSIRPSFRGCLVRLAHPLVAAALLTSVAGCGGGDLLLPQDTAPAAITPIAGNGQTGLVGAELAVPLVVRVDDVEGEPVANALVAFQLAAGAVGGDIAPDTVTTDADGEASSEWVLGGTEGQQSVTASVVGQSLVATFSAQAERSSQLTLERSSGNGQEAAPGSELSAPLVVRLVDERGDGVSGRAVAWVVATGGGQASPETSTTDADGFASTGWTLGEDTDNTLNAVVSGVGVVSFTATAVSDGAGVPSASRSSITASPDNIVAGIGASVITVTVLDAQGDPVAGVSVELAATGVGNDLTQPEAPTDANGRATGMLQSALPGSKVVSAVAGEVELDATAEVTVSVLPDPDPEADHLVFLVEPSSPQQEDEAITPPLQVAIVDADGNVFPLSGVEIELELIRDNRAHDFDGDPTQTTVGGVAVFTDLEIDHHHDDFRFRATAPGMPELGTAETSLFEVDD